MIKDIPHIERYLRAKEEDKKPLSRFDKKRALNHYQEQVRQLDIMQEELLIQAFRVTGDSPSGLSVKILVEVLEIETGYKITENAIQAFKTYIAAETLRTDQER